MGIANILPDLPTILLLWHCTKILKAFNPCVSGWESLSHEFALHKVGKSQCCQVTTAKLYNLDGKDFIQTVIKEGLRRWLASASQKDGSKPASRVHITMNLPAMATEFLVHFRGLLRYGHYQVLK